MRTDYKAKLCRDLSLHAACGSLPPYQVEYRPFTSRGWRIDIYYPAEVTPSGVAVGVEYEGLAWVTDGKSRHQTNVGLTKDAEKYDWITVAGICLVRVTAPMVRSGLAERLIKAAVLGEWPEDGPVRRAENHG